MPRTMLHLGGNGHASARLGAARAALAARPGGIELVDVPYPGFEGRPGSASLDAFLGPVGASCRGRRPGRSPRGSAP